MLEGVVVTSTEQLLTIDPTTQNPDPLEDPPQESPAPNPDLPREPISSSEPTLRNQTSQEPENPEPKNSVTDEAPNPNRIKIRNKKSSAPSGNPKGTQAPVPTGNNNYYQEYLKTYLCNKYVTKKMKEMIAERDDLLNKINTLTIEIEQNFTVGEGSEVSEPEVDRNIMENLVRSIAAECAGQDGKQKRVRKKKNEMVRNFVCTVGECGKTYATENSLNQHMRNKHADEYQTWKATQKSAEKTGHLEDSTEKPANKSSMGSDTGKPTKKLKTSSIVSGVESDTEKVFAEPGARPEGEKVKAEVK